MVLICLLCYDFGFPKPIIQRFGYHMTSWRSMHDSERDTTTLSWPRHPRLQRDEAGHSRSYSTRTLMRRCLTTASAVQSSPVNSRFASSLIWLLVPLHVKQLRHTIG